MSEEREELNKAFNRSRSRLASRKYWPRHCPGARMCHSDLQHAPELLTGSRQLTLPLGALIVPAISVRRPVVVNQNQQLRVLLLPQ